jgi:hypothetical protein
VSERAFARMGGYPAAEERCEGCSGCEQCGYWGKS